MNLPTFAIAATLLALAVEERMANRVDAQAELAEPLDVIAP